MHCDTDRHVDFVQKAVQFTGTQQDLADAINHEFGATVAQATVSSWIARNKRLTVERALQIEAITYGYLSAESVYPDLFKYRPLKRGRSRRASNDNENERLSSTANNR